MLEYRRVQRIWDDDIKGYSFWCIDRRHAECPYPGMRDPKEIGCRCRCHDKSEPKP